MQSHPFTVVIFDKLAPPKNVLKSTDFDKIMLVNGGSDLYRPHAGIMFSNSEISRPKFAHMFPSFVVLSRSPLLLEEKATPLHSHRAWIRLPNENTNLEHVNGLLERPFPPFSFELHRQNSCIRLFLCVCFSSAS